MIDRCQCCGQPLPLRERAAILKTGALTRNPDGSWSADGWDFAGVSHIGGWTPKEMADIAATEREIMNLETKNE